MRTIRFIAVFLMGILLILSACASPATNVAPVPAAAAPSPTAAPAPTTAAVPAAPTTPASTQTAAPVITTAPAPAPAGGEASFAMSDLKLTPSRVQSPGVVNISVKVTNTGGREGTYPVVMEFKGDDDVCPLIAPLSISVTLAPGASKDVAFDIPLEGGGGYTVLVGKLKERLIVD